MKTRWHEDENKNRESAEKLWRHETKIITKKNKNSLPTTKICFIGDREKNFSSGNTSRKYLWLFFIAVEPLETFPEIFILQPWRLSWIWLLCSSLILIRIFIYWYFYENNNNLRLALLHEIKFTLNSNKQKPRNFQSLGEMLKTHEKFKTKTWVFEKKC